MFLLDMISPIAFAAYAGAGLFLLALALAGIISILVLIWKMC